MNFQNKENAIMEKEFSNEYVKYVFSENEKKEIASEMAQKVSEQNQAEDDKKAIMSDLKSRIDRIQAEVNSAATKLNNGYEMRNIKCEVIRDYKRKVIQFMRTDNGEIAREKPMTADDLQMRMEDNI